MVGRGTARRVSDSLTVEEWKRSTLGALVNRVRFWRDLRRVMPPKEFEEYVTYWNSRYGTGSPVSGRLNPSSND